MRLAIGKAREGVSKGQTPFGACIVKGNEVVSIAHNLVWKTTDITAHAEIVAIRAACKRIKTIDLSGCRIYSSYEPCPMCFSACHWARLDSIFYAADIADAKSAGFNELSVSNIFLKEKGKSPIIVRKGVLKSEAGDLFLKWLKRKDRRGY